MKRDLPLSISLSIKGKGSCWLVWFRQSEFKCLFKCTIHFPSCFEWTRAWFFSILCKHVSDMFWLLSRWRFNSSMPTHIHRHPPVCSPLCSCAFDIAINAHHMTHSRASPQQLVTPEMLKDQCLPARDFRPEDKEKAARGEGELVKTTSELKRLCSPVDKA